MLKNVRLHILTIISLCAICRTAWSQTDSIAHSVTMHDIEVITHASTSDLRNTGTGRIEWNMHQLKDLPQILGNADPIHYAQMLPGIQTTGEYRSGIFVQGCDNSHSQLSIGQVSIYNVNHLLGFFSTFNATHFPSMQLDKAPLSALTTSHLGGTLDMQLPTATTDSLSADLSLGLISSQGTLRMPLGKRTQLTLSGRISYINLLYPHWLDADDQSLRYSFYDSNITLSHQFNEHHSIVVNYYGGNDKGTLSKADYDANMGAHWGNQMASLTHTYRSDDCCSLQNTLYLTSYHNQYELGIQQMQLELPSGISDFGYKGELNYDRYSMALEVIHHDIEPQHLKSSGSFHRENDQATSTHTLESALGLQYRQPLARHLNWITGIRGILYGSQKTGYYWSVDPSSSIEYNNYQIQCTLGYALRHQYLFQTGFSDVGLPSECWISASRQFHPQWAHIATAGISSYLFHRMFRCSVDLFYRQMYHQMEYTGSILDLYNTDYHLEDHISMGKGRNYGFSIMLNKCAGRLTGWASYTYTHARRTFDANPTQRTYPANHERPHEFNTVMTYAFGRHVSAGATYVFASGTPFTAPVSIAALNGILITQYGEHNANRLAAYNRLDLSANYRWQGRHHQEHGINLSLYNALSSRNQLFYYVSVLDDGSYVYKPLCFVLDILPSLSYFLKF